MAVLLDAKDLMAIDQECAAESKVWEVLKQGAKSITEADFIGANEVRINKMTGFTASDYIRGENNTRTKINIDKETRKLENERWVAYDIDTLDQGENAGVNVANIMEEHTRLVAIPEKDKVAVTRLLENAGTLVQEAITEANAFEAYDAAEQKMTDEEVIGPYVLFCSSEFYKSLKNSEKVTNALVVNEIDMGGVNRRVAQLDGEIPIIQVPKSRLQVDSDKKINFILVPLRIAAPLEKYNDITLVPASADRSGYRDTIKGLNYFDLIIFDNAKKAIYVSYE